MLDDVTAAFGVVILAILVVFIFVDESTIFTTGSTQPTTTFATTTIPIGTIDLDQNGIVQEESLKNGNDYILAVSSNWSGSKNLLYLDSNQDGFITLADPVFQYLAITSPVNNYIPIPISTFGIRAIRFVKSKDNSTIGYQAIFSDSSPKWIYTH